MDLKSRIKFAIKRQGFTLEQVAAKMKRPDGSVGLAQSALSQMLANGNPSYNKLEEIAGIIGLSVSELVQDQNENKIVCPYCGNTLRLTKDTRRPANEFVPLTKTNARELVGLTVEWYSEDQDTFGDDDLNAIAVVKSFDETKVHPLQSDSLFGPELAAIIDDYGLTYNDGAWIIDINADEVLTMNSHPIWFAALSKERFTLTKSRKFVNGWVVYDSLHQYVCTFRERRLDQTAVFTDLKSEDEAADVREAVKADIVNWLKANHGNLL